MVDLHAYLSSLQWKFLAVFEAFTEPVSLDVVGSLVPLPPAQLFDLLQSAQKEGWICQLDNGLFTLSDSLPVKARARLSRINNRARLNALVNQLQVDGTAETLNSKAYIELLKKSGRNTEPIRQALKQNREFIRNLNRKTSQRAINNVIKNLLALEENSEYAPEFIDLVIDLSNRIMSTHRLIALLKKALKSAERIDDQRRWTLIQFKLGYAYYSEFQVSEAFSALSAGKVKVDELTDKDLTIQSAGYIGLYYHMRGMYPVAAEYLSQASQAEAHDDSIFVFSWAALYLSMNEAYLGRLHNAIGRTHYLCHHARIPGNDRLEAAIKSFAKYTLALALLMLGKQDISERLFQEIRQSKAIDSAQLNFYVLKTLGYLLMKSGRIAEGLDLWNDSFKKWHGPKRHGQYISAFVLEIITSIEEDGHKPPDGWGFEEQYSAMVNGPNVHLKGVALRIKASKTMDHDSKTALAYLQESEKCLLQTGDNIQLAITRLEITKLEGLHGRTDIDKEGLYQILSAVPENNIYVFPDHIRETVDVFLCDAEKRDTGIELMDGIFELLGQLAPCSTVDEAFSLVLTAVSDYFKAERACFFKLDEDILKLTELTYSLHMSADEVTSADFYPCLVNIKKCHQENTPRIFSENTSTAVDELKAPKSYFCIPLNVNSRLSGVLYFDNICLDVTINQTKQDVLSRLGPILNHYLQQVHRLEGNVKSDRDIVLQKSAEIRRQRYPDMVYQSREMSSLIRKAGRMATSEATILINGETGVGKEMMARWLHENSPFRENPFVVVDFSTLPENLLESELFGHEKGSFTGADRKKIGRIELAHNGTLFIDEIGEIPLHLQVKLLRVLQEKQFFRVGGIKPVHSDFRLLVATNRDLGKEVSAGRFRQDLYYRLNVLNIKISPLRERPKDIIALALHFFDVYKKKHSRPSLILLPEHEEILLDYSWPGNIRELKNAMERSVLASEDNKLDIDLQIQSAVSTHHPFDEEPTLDELQAQYIQYMLEKHRGRIGGPKGAARVLGLKRTSLYARMKKLGIRP